MLKIALVIAELPAAPRVVDQSSLTIGTEAHACIVNMASDMDRVRPMIKNDDVA